ncbi:aspartyl/asparaginyl beta-hydroxylase domain-containing protein [Micromonospora sp. NPDC047812]|uniref:aspartyl/asparaginyl beta-hydroxylase domain-containing protein n=1 Tax=Micromonospora sp. NPDC047812 TaxID=3155742 RepID=UPI003456CE8B
MTTVMNSTETGILGTCDIDADGLATDLDTMASFPYTDKYSDFVCGAWKSCAVWNGTGQGLDAGLDPYEGPAVVTDLGERLPYVRHLVGELFDLSLLKYGRLARLTPGSALVPHRDYLELDTNLIRIHLPLETDESCVSSHNTTLYHMNVGEIWFLDATQAHSAVSDWTKDRTHLVLDFQADSLAACFTGEVQSPSIPSTHQVARQPVDREELAAFERAGVLMDTTNYRDFLKIAIKTMFTRDITPDGVFDLLEGAARHSPAAARLDMIPPMRRYFLLARES